MRIERTAKTVIAGLMSVACLASVAACGPGSSSNKANTETEARARLTGLPLIFMSRTPAQGGAV